MIALAMLLSVAAFAESTDFSGIWHLNEVIADEITMPAADFGLTMNFDLKADGTAEIHQVHGEETDDQQGTWAAEGDTVTITTQDEDIVFALAEDGNLMSTDEDLKLVLGREKSEVEVFTPAEPKVDATAEDYAGNWKAFKMEADGAFMSVEALGMDLDAAIEGTTVTVNGIIFTDEVAEITFADGALTFTAEDPDAAMLSGLKAQLLEDDMMLLTLTISGDMTFVMQRAE